MKGRVFLRADGNHEIGMGHVTRSIALGSMLSNKFDCFLFTRYLTNYLREECKEANIQIRQLEDDDHYKEFLDELFGDEIVVLDNYFFSANYQLLIKNIGCKLVSIDDIGGSHFHSDIVINQSPAANLIDYSTEPYSKLLLGLRYALLRRVFRVKNETETSSLRIRSILLCFGGSDAYNLINTYATELLNNTEVSLEIILGTDSKINDFSFEVAQQSRISIHKDLDQYGIANLIRKVDLAIVPSSSLLFEVIALRKRFLTGFFVDNQKGIAKYIESNYPRAYVGDFRNGNLMDAMKKIQVSYPTKVFELIDGKSHIRLLTEFENLTKIMSEVDIQVESASLKDSHFIFTLSNEGVVRENSFSPNKIKKNEHENWMHKQLNNDDEKLFILKIEGQRFGVVKFSKKKGSWIIGISLSQKFRGKSLSAISLRRAIDTSNINEEIYAYIKPTNIASIKSFKKAGFGNEKEVIFNKNKCIEMLWK